MVEQNNNVRVDQVELKADFSARFGYIDGGSKKSEIIEASIAYEREIHPSSYYSSMYFWEGRPVCMVEMPPKPVNKEDLRNQYLDGKDERFKELFNEVTKWYEQDGSENWKNRVKIAEEKVMEAKCRNFWGLPEEAHILSLGDMMIPRLKKR